MTSQPSADPAIFFEKTRFLTSAARLAQCPTDRGVEVAFAGRSNAGKSSAINALTRNRKLARTSKTPGRTQLINFFALADDNRLVDLPGYGFARVPPSVKQAWERLIDSYLRARRSLAALVLVMDIRHPLTEFDRMMLAWARRCGLPVHILLTKADKLSRGQAAGVLQRVRRDTAEAGTITAQVFSAQRRTGVDELAGQLEQWLHPPAPGTPDEPADGR